MKRILTVQDISCVGKCSLTVALPIISAFGIEASILPTAVLSTHTAFKHFTFRDLSRDIPAICCAWKDEGLEFDGIYTGYLGSKEQISQVLRIFQDFGQGKLKFVDPAMGDNGVLYKGFSKDYALEMAKLCAKADIIVPNLTEACFMTGKPYIASGYDEDYIRDILIALTKLGCDEVILTGVGFEDNKLGCYGYNATKGKFWCDFNEKKPQSFHGTGDVFASVCFALIMKGASLSYAAEAAADFVCDSIDATLEDEKPIWYGVNFEKVLQSEKSRKTDNRN